MKRIVHILRSNAFVIDRSISKLLSTNFPDTTIYIADAGGEGAQFHLAHNNEWISKLPSTQFGGVLSKSRLYRIKSGYARSLISLCWCEFKLKSILKLVFGPRHIVFHGYLLHPVAIVILRLCLKKVYYIHWGGKRDIPIAKTKLCWIWRHTLRFYEKIVLLMSPERKYFDFVKPKKIIVKPYPSPSIANAEILFEKENLCANDRAILIGNSAWYLDSYREFLGKCALDGWEIMTFMLAYGNEGNPEVESFISENNKRFGALFDAWVHVLPVDEYLQKIRQYEYYCCAVKEQTGLGAIYSSVLQGKTLVLRGDNYLWMRELGVKCTDFERVGEMSYHNLSKWKLSVLEKIENAMKLRNKFRCEFCLSNWLDFIV